MPFIMQKEFRMKWLNKKNIRKWLRLLHRDLGYFLVGITIVYGISGFILNHKNTGQDPAFKTISVQEKWSHSLTIDQLQEKFTTQYEEISLNKVIPEETGYQLFLKGGVGNYNALTGELWFEVYKKKPIIFFFNKLHYNQKKHWTTPADFFAFGMIFLALSGLFMVRGPKGFKGRGKWFALGGIVLVILYIWL